ncbi:MAG: substrate-binding domain-containing protein [Planctomycetota bacterium]|nr:substrate-binding domain-containing protein [Planctomycetota bacterium]
MARDVFSVTLDRKSGIPAYRQVQEEYRNRILGGVFPEGMVFPSEGAMARELRLNKLTLRRAILELEKEGLVRKAQGRPTLVSQRSEWVQTQRRAVVSIMIPDDVFEPYKEELLGHLCRHCVRLGMDVRVCREAEAGASLESIPQNGVDGILTYPSPRPEYAARLEKVTVPLLVFEMREDIPGHADRVVVDNLNGYRQALEHLKALGHREIFYIGALVGRKNLDGTIRYAMLRNTHFNTLFFRRAMEDAGLDASPERCLEMPFQQEGADALIRKLMEARERPTALIVFNDELAQFAIRALNRRGLTVPDDISVVGGGRFPDAVAETRLATVAVDRDEMARTAAQRMHERMKNGGLAGLVIEIATRFVNGATVGPAPKRQPVEP